MRDYIYDLETYVNVFTMAVEHADSGLRWSFEISDWCNDSKEIIAFLQWLKDQGARMVGFNNLAFDYPILHMLVRMGHSDALTLYQKAQSIIETQNNDKWAHQVKLSDRFVEQLDLFKIHHFDNMARATSLKVLEFNMRSETIEDLPFDVGTTLTAEQVPVLKRYNAHDVTETKKFYFKSLEMIRFREELTTKHQQDFMNHSDPKIGENYFIMELEKAGVQCYDYGPDGRTPRQTRRASIALKDAILPGIVFQQPEFTRVMNWLKEQVITDTKGVFKNLHTMPVNSEIKFVFGLGGVHASIENEIVEAEEGTTILDVDATSYYPKLAIVNRFYPNHLGDTFCDIYEKLFEQRKKYPKKSAESQMLKLALVASFGKSNSPFSVFYDPMVTMRITLNGQLLLCLLAEGLMGIPGLRLLQCNTDGVSVKVPNGQLPLVKNVCDAWEKRTGMNLESAEYSRMFIRDVNNYIAEYVNGDVKRKGTYEHAPPGERAPLGWHQNLSALVVPKVTEKVLLEDAPIAETVRNWPDFMDFMLRTKVPRNSYLALRIGEEQTRLQNTTRYYVAEGGGNLIKWMPPLADWKEWRSIGIDAGWGVQVCNDIKDAGRLPVDFEYYIREVEKRVLILK
ncbi:hypothetical protein LCGC14_0470550 [marine sediment metagenome]|uniref:Uncharacterized protein n=1 Tax=marine sediment metagenome TaxID=412755 RepID=A0A0F9UZ59_9ZZZZ